MPASSFDPLPLLTEELGLPRKSIAAVIELFSEGNTIPFIARYRKEATGNLDEVQIRTIQERFTYLNELEDRRQTILTSIESQGKLTEELKELILACDTKTALEDLYMPYKPKRRTRAMIAREKGLEPLALRIFEQPLKASPGEEAAQFVDAEKGVASIEEALAGARDIAAEMMAENAEARGAIREMFNKHGLVCSKVVKGKDAAPTKFEQYYDFSERVSEIPSHRYLAIRRGETEEILECRITIDEEAAKDFLQTFFKRNRASLYCHELEKACEDSLKRLLLPGIETDVRVELKMKSDRAAVDVFAENLRNLLLSSPLGGRSVIGIDPGIRTGCKCAAVDETGKYLGAVTIYPFQGERQQEQSRLDLMRFILAHKPFAIGVGNGTAGRETESFVRKLLADANRKDIIIVPVSEAGASVYSASDIAREEFPDLDLTLRGAISIARRLQDPLAELVKIDPKAIGVGQYQHDVYQQLLQEKLAEVVESCVNHVGVEVNTASAPLLSYVAGIGSSLAQKIVKHRERNGAFTSRKQLLEVPGLGPKTFEQAAGFLRVRDGLHPLDSSAVHPERYDLVELIAKDMGVPLEQLIANQAMTEQIDAKKYVTSQVGMLTLADIIAELKKPGRDPRASFEKPAFREDVMSINDLKAGMKLEGIVTNVAAFGVFVDIGVHQDGFIHISELADRFIKDPAEVMRVGDKVKVEVLSVDIPRNRISLSAKTRREQKPQAKAGPKKQTFSNNPFSSL